MSADASSTRAEQLAGEYQIPAGVYDELRSADGALRPHWQQFFQHLDALPIVELQARWDKARQLLHQNGISYDVHGDPEGLERPWFLSPIPVLVSREDWQTLEDGLAQRARLLDALLRDLYGPQRSLIDDLVPPELVFENPAFLRSCHGLGAPLDCWLPLYCADLIRLPHGAFAVVEDRTDAPSGAGYALENRIVISSVLPEAFRDCNVERLAFFFRTLRDTLQALSPHNRDNPRIVLLSSDPNNATYFEQAYLAQYLGYTLVNGADLTVRRDRVFLKTLGGLQPVDVILRRVRDQDCDPLELRPESTLGVPGLVQAIRAGNVAVGNPLGTGVLQTPALLPYLDRLSRALLGEELRLPSLRTLWCGDPLSLREALSLFDDVVVKPTFADGSVAPLFTAALTSAQREEWKARIQAAPRRYVVQERARSSLTPALAGASLAPRSLAMRCFVVAGRDGYTAMPGGLSRVTETGPDGHARVDLGDGSKDTWVLSRGSVPKFSLLPPSHRTAPLSRGGSDLPSRATDNLYWLGRYAERAEAVARLVRALGARLNELGNEDEMERSAEFGPLFAALHAQTALLHTAPLSGYVPWTLQTARQQLIDAVWGEHGGGTVKAAVRSALRAGRLVRDRISTDTWRVLAALGDDLHEDVDPSRGTLAALQEVLSRIILRLAAFSGLVMDSMTRGHAWRFLDTGRRLERAVTAISLVRATLVGNCRREGALLESVLEVADSGMTYRRRYLATLQVAPVVDLLLTDETNPRSVIYQMEAIQQHIQALPQSADGMRSPQELIALRVLTALKLTDVERICAIHDGGERTELDELLCELGTRIPELSESLCARYLSHATVLRQLTIEENPLTP